MSDKQLSLKQISELEDQIRKLENQKKLLEKPTPKTTVFLIAIISFILPFTIIASVVGISTFIGPSLSEQADKMIAIFIVSVLLAIPTAKYLFDSGKQSNKETIERTNIEIQRLKKEIDEF